MFNKCFKTIKHSNSVSLALLAMRVVSGIAFAFHGWGKIQNPMAWMGADSPVPGIFQFLAALSEFGGGLCWAAGLLVPLASAGIGFTMIVAVYLHMIVMKDPFVKMTETGGSYELASVYLTISLLLLVTGPGKFSLDSKVFGDKK